MAKGKKVIQNPGKISADMRLKIGQVPIMNEKILQDLSKLHQMPIMQVRGIIDFMGRYTKGVIEEGIMETVMLPGFGKFAPNIKRLQGIKKSMNGIKNGKQLLYLALKGKNINFVPEINPTEYTILKASEKLRDNQPEGHIYEEVPEDKIEDNETT